MGYAVSRDAGEITDTTGAVFCAYPDSLGCPDGAFANVFSANRIKTPYRALFNSISPARNVG